MQVYFLKTEFHRGQRDVYGHSIMNIYISTVKMLYLIISIQQAYFWFFNVGLCLSILWNLNFILSNIFVCFNLLKICLINLCGIVLFLCDVELGYIFYKYLRYHAIFVYDILTHVSAFIESAEYKVRNFRKSKYLTWRILRAHYN